MNPGQFKQQPNQTAGKSLRKVLLVGGGGYIGAVITQQLLLCAYQVRVFDALFYENAGCVLPYLLNPNYEFMRGDLRNLRQIEEALCGITDVIILAGLVGDPITKKYPEYSNSINSEGIRCLIDQLNARKLNRVIFISTCSNYGLIEQEVLADEEWELKPLSLYAKSKVENERHLLSLKGKVDYCPSILRFATAFGVSPRMRFDLTVNEFTRELYLGKELLVYDHDTWRPYCHVQDFARALKCVLEAPDERVAFEVFNAGSEENNYTKKMIIEAIKQFIPDVKVIYQKQGSDPRNYRVNFHKIRDRLNFEAQYSVVEGIQEILAGLKNGLFDDVDKRVNFYGNHSLVLSENMLNKMEVC